MSWAVSDSSEVPGLLLNCPRCSGRFRAGVRETPYFAKCPECYEPVRVPAAAEVEDDWNFGADQDSNREDQDDWSLGPDSDSEPDRRADRKKPPELEPDTYRLSLPTDWGDLPEDRPKPSSAPPPSPSKPQSQADPPDPSEAEIASLPVPQNVSVTCPACSASFEPAVSDQDQVVLCPECLEDVPVPAAKNIPKPAPKPTPKTPSAPKPKDSDDIPWDDSPDAPNEPEPAPRKKRKKKKPRTEPEPRENPSTRERPAKTLSDTLAEVRQVEDEPPPEWTFFSGVTDFLIRPEVVMRWVFASLGVCLMGWLCLLCINLYNDHMVLAAGCFFLPLIWITIWVMSYVTSCSLPILVETSAGNDKIVNWPEPVLKEQALDLMYLSYMMIITQVFAFFVSQLLGIVIGPRWVVWLIAVHLMYPVVLLSSMEANSSFVPLTMPILKSFKTVTWAWGVFYGLTAGLLLVWLLPLVWMSSRSGSTQFFGMIFIAPLAAGWCFLSARLLGRLAWRASLEYDEEDEDDPDNPPRNKRKKKKKPPKVSESSGELHAAPP